jgi:hypothetical protein
MGGDRGWCQLAGRGLRRTLRLNQQRSRTAAVARIWRSDHPALRLSAAQCIREEDKQRTFDCSGIVTRRSTTERTGLRLIALASEDGRHYEFSDATEYAAVAAPRPPKPQLPAGIPHAAVSLEGVLQPVGSETGSGIAVVLEQGVGPSLL